MSSFIFPFATNQSQKPQPQTQWLSYFQRLEHKGVPIYIDAERPDWFVPSSHTDLLLQRLMQSASIPEAVAGLPSERAQSPTSLLLDISGLQDVLSRPAEPSYCGRADHLKLNKLTEIWYHLTDTCNLACRHCLFSASPARKRSVDRMLLERSIDQASELGCRIFYFTGGEPFLYPDFMTILKLVQASDPLAHAVILTNGLLIGDQLPGLLELDRNRLHLQISLDGLEAEHDFLRGQGNFRKLQSNLTLLREHRILFTNSVAVNSDNVRNLSEIARQAAEFGATGLHLMYHFIRGKGTDRQFVEPEILFDKIIETRRTCPDLQIDNIETIKSRIFSMPGSKHDLSNMAWESLAVGPDNNIYPSPALISIASLACGSLEQPLADVWQKSGVLDRIRRSSLIDSREHREHPLRFLTGGDDSDHSFTLGQTFVGNDPYRPLYELLSLELISEQAATYPDQGLFRLRMGDFRHDCPDDETGDSPVKMTHCNCVISLASKDTYSSVRSFYGSAANQANEEIVNPFGPGGTITDFIPEVSRKRSYGCGSPVQDAGPRQGEVLVDLGSGSGVECFLAAREVGPTGKVYGIDMTDDMLDLADQSKRKVVQELGYDNVEFRKGYLEAIPLPDNSADVVISNCVINLSPDKRRTYLEIFRVLKPGGRLIVSDVVTDEHVALSIRNSATFRGQCLGGAMRQKDLVTMLGDCGFTKPFLHKRYPYRMIKDDRFFSLTYEATKPPRKDFFTTVATVVYRGPHQALVTQDSILLRPGFPVTLPGSDALELGSQVFQLDRDGAVTNIEQSPCNCGVDQSAPLEQLPTPTEAEHPRDCMVCGASLRYHRVTREMSCHFCQLTTTSSCDCENDHFACDRCHQAQSGAIIRHLCLTSAATDMLELLNLIRNHPRVPMHGPEHHTLVPGIIMTAYKNSGGALTERHILTAFDRAEKVPGGVCGFWGVCGAAIGAGIAASIILEATPLTPGKRQQAQRFSAAILSAVSQIQGGRCCQRETSIVLKETARLSQPFFDLQLRAEQKVQCHQYALNQACIKSRCPLWDERVI